jgi:NADH dehydrogenase FAD-containing subunit
MLPGTLAGQFSPDEMQIDLQKLVARASATLILADVTSVDWSQRVLHFDNAESLKFDILSIGVGSIPAGLPEDTAAGLVPIKPMQTFLRRLDERLDVVAPKPGQLLKVVIVGGGVASIEIALCLQSRLHFYFPYSNIRIRILTSADEIVDELPTSSIKRVRLILQARGIEVVTQSRVTEVDHSSITINGVDRQSADYVIWSTGAAAPPVLSRLGLPVDSRGFLVTKPTLQSTIDPLVFAVGDSGCIPETPFPKAGVYAVRQSPVLWHNIKALLNGGPLLEFKPQSDFLKLLNTGDGRALLLYKSVTVHARWCWTLKTWIDRRFLKHFRV